MKKIFAAMAAVLLLASCGSQPRLTKEEVIDKGETGFSDIVSYIVEGYQSRWEEISPDMKDLCNVYCYCSPYCGFCQKDINGDGIPELLLGDKYEDGSTVLYDIFTIHPKSASLIHLASGGERYRFSVYESGTIIEEGTDPAFKRFTKAYRIKKGNFVEMKTAARENCPTDMDITTFASLVKEDSILYKGYSGYREPDMSEYLFFREVTDNVEGMSFTPLNVRTQIANGVNFKYYCRFSGGTGEDSPGHCDLTIFRPFPGQGEPEITSIETIS